MKLVPAEILQFTIAAPEDMGTPGTITFRLTEDNDSTTLALTVEHDSVAISASSETVAAVARRWHRLLRTVKELPEA